MTSKVPAPLRAKLLALAVALAAGTAGLTTYQNQHPSEEVLVAMEVGSWYESSGRHIGKPYIDHVGKGKPWTVCAGVTGPGVIPGVYYTPEDCKRLEMPHYQKAEAQAKQVLKYWDTYNVWTRAGFIDMAFNVPSALDASTTMVKKANAGDLDGACDQMNRWINGRVNGALTPLPGLVGRRGTTDELCAEWGRPGHFSVVKAQ